VPYSKLRSRTSWLALLLVCLVLWIASCQRNDDPAATPTRIEVEVPVTVEVTRVVERLITPTPTPPTANCLRGPLANTGDIVIGAILPLSRPGAMLSGFAMQTALSLAVEDVNAAGGVAGKNLRLVTYDSANSAERATIFAERLLSLDCAAVLVGVYHSQVAQAVKEVAHRAGVPVIFASAIADELTSDQSPEVFRIGPTFTMLAQMPAHWLAEVGDYNEDGARFAVIVMDEAGDANGLVKASRHWLEENAFHVDVITVDLPTTDFSSVIARIVALEQAPDAVFINISSDAALTLQQQMVAAGIRPQQNTLVISSMVALNEQAFWAHVPDGLYTVVPRSGPWPSTVTPLGAQFAERFRTYFDRWPEIAAFAAYDAVRLAADAIRRANTLAPADLITALETSDVELASGHYTFAYGSHNPPDGKETPTYLWHQWLNVPLLYLQYSEPGQAASQAPVIWPPLYRTAGAPLLRPGE
jgi:branched-chain amino acid transport system substrate-binding protein